MESLENQLLIAMPALDDAYFNKTVTYICEHNEEGAMGLIINLPVNVTLNELLVQIDAKKEEAPELGQQVLTGGPVSQDRGFVLHSPQSCWKQSLSLSKEVMITTSKDILMALGTEEAPEKYMVTLGYAGWGPGQLEEELKNNAWLLTPADGDIVFNTPIEQRWKKATEKLGIDMAHLSSDIGHA
ncbi:MULTISPECIES: YqgE/AlgH family protein [unclassified Colwellia]|uniref:YqgE/AlgH family protein n=1 Tax=unclassified Colwellia TaxID=196834 RepID=UPI0015F55277|nr:MULTISPECIES: YqgE/AlgH family protein [unclassified Colwellia]MBA6231717.1 YqgE/AlgH family protein [Colwellia sp. MB02u-7]MBA6235581.1 YqgE/AlgH family protein [Colwellia sp. MB02u-11]MBA6254906.1 YqgE/AlgH family protein [Colwellia sp. MB3u-28]MBA6259688.1 YqgE/AlgH family protein [Colwellia sp. MB3u-41]MBA6299569.1 YqgE/AlgH family protein [Colwellia sp. MB3u-22]